MLLLKIKLELNLWSSVCIPSLESLSMFLQKMFNLLRSCFLCYFSVLTSVFSVLTHVLGDSCPVVLIRSDSCWLLRARPLDSLYFILPNCISWVNKIQLFILPSGQTFLAQHLLVVSKRGTPMVDFCCGNASILFKSYVSG